MKSEAMEIITVETHVMPDDYHALEEYIKSLPEVSEVKFRIRKMAAAAGLEHLPVMWDMVVHLSKEALPHLQKDGETLAVSAAGAWLGAKIKNFVDGRNEAKKKEIEAGDDTPLLYDAYDNVIKVDKKD